MVDLIARVDVDFKVDVSSQIVVRKVDAHDYTSRQVAIVTIRCAWIAKMRGRQVLISCEIHLRPETVPVWGLVKDVCRTSAAGEWVHGAAALLFSLGTVHYFLLSNKWNQVRHLLRTAVDAFPIVLTWLAMGPVS